MHLNSCHCDDERGVILRAHWRRGKGWCKISAMASLWRLASRSGFPVAAAFCAQPHRLTFCDSAEPKIQRDGDEEPLSSPNPLTTTTASSTDEKTPKPHVFKENVFKEGMRPHAQGDYHGLFPKRQLWQPKLEYPLWDNDWDGREPRTTGDKEEDRNRTRKIRKTGVTRHIILIRHGQYDETHKVCRPGKVRSRSLNLLLLIVVLRRTSGRRETYSDSTRENSIGSNWKETGRNATRCARKIWNVQH
jgi:hypothetical protein